MKKLNIILIAVVILLLISSCAPALSVPSSVLSTASAKTVDKNTTSSSDSHEVAYQDEYVKLIRVSNFAYGTCWILEFEVNKAVLSCK